MFPSTRPPSNLPKQNLNPQSQQKLKNLNVGSGSNNNTNQSGSNLTLFPVSPVRIRSPSAFPDEEFIEDTKAMSHNLDNSQNKQRQQSRRVSFSTQDDVRDFIGENRNVDLRCDDLDFIETAYLVLDAMDKTYLLDDDIDESARSSSSSQKHQTEGDNTIWNWFDLMCCTGVWDSLHISSSHDAPSPDNGSSNINTAKNVSSNNENRYENILSKELLDSFEEALQFRVSRMTIYPEHNESRATCLARKMQSIKSKYGFPQLEEHHTSSSSDSQLRTDKDNSKASASVITSVEKIHGLSQSSVSDNDIPLERGGTIKSALFNQKKNSWTSFFSSLSRVSSNVDDRNEKNSYDDDNGMMNRDDEQEEMSCTNDSDVAMYYPHYGDKSVLCPSSENVVAQSTTQKPANHHNKKLFRPITLEEIVSTKKGNTYNSDYHSNGHVKNNDINYPSNLTSKNIPQHMGMRYDDNVSHPVFLSNERQNNDTLCQDQENKICSTTQQSHYPLEKTSLQLEGNFVQKCQNSVLNRIHGDDCDLFLEPLNVIDYNHQMRRNTSDKSPDIRPTPIIKCNQNPLTELILEPIENAIDTKDTMCSKQESENSLLVLEPLGFSGNGLTNGMSPKSPVIDLRRDEYPSGDMFEMCQLRQNIMNDIVKLKNIHASTNDNHVKRNCESQIEELKVKLMKSTDIFARRKNKKVIYYR